MVLKHHEAGLRVGGAGAGGGGAASCPTPGTPWVQPAQPTHTGPRRETVSRTQGLKDSTTREGVPVETKKGQSREETGGEENYRGERR